MHMIVYKLGSRYLDKVPGQQSDSPRPLARKSLVRADCSRGLR